MRRVVMMVDGYELNVDVYAVGWLLKIQQARGMWKLGKKKKARDMFRMELKYCWGQLRKKNFRAVKSTFNGYLAEPEHFPPGIWENRRRCGTGWTQERAIDDLRQKVLRRDEAKRYR